MHNKWLNVYRIFIKTVQFPILKSIIKVWRPSSPLKQPIKNTLTTCIPCFEAGLKKSMIDCFLKTKAQLIWHHKIKY